MNSSVRVLIVDDSPVDRILLKAILQKLGIRHIHEAEDGQSGAYKIKTAISTEQKFDLVFIDWEMPKVDGITLLKAIRQQPDAKGLKIVMITGHSEKEHVEQAKAVGITGFIVKPLDPAVIEKRVLEFLSAK